MLERLLSLIAVLALLVSASGAHAAWTENGVELFWHSHPNGPFHLGPDETGGVFSWVRVYAGGATEVYRVNRVLADGTPVADWTPIDYPTTGFAPDGNGGFYRAYYRNVSPTQRYDAFLVHNLADGSLDPAWPGASHEVGVAVTTAYEMLPAIASDGAGGAFCAYVVGNFDQIRLKRVVASGTFAAGWPAAGVSIYGGSTGPVTTPMTMRPDGAGGAFLVWQTQQLMIQRVTSTGALAAGWTPDGIAVSSNSLEAQVEVLDVFASGPDHLIVVWTDNTAGQQGVWSQRIHRNGYVAPEWPEAGLRVVTGTLAGGARPDGAGGIFVSWWDGSTLRLTRRNADGDVVAPWPAEGATLATLGDSGNVPAGGGTVVEGAEGGLIVCWKDARVPGKARWRARWLLADGAPDPAQPDTSTTLTPPADSVTAFIALTDGQGGLYYEWQDTGYEYSHFVKMGHAARPQSNTGVDPMRALNQLSVAPNPMRLGCEVRFALRGEVPARLELLDLAGRRVRSQEVAGAGAHLERFEGLGRLAPGVYLVRLTEGAESRIARVALIH